MTIYSNEAAKSWSISHTSNVSDLSLVQRFHHGLPGFKRTPLVRLDDLAQEIGVSRIFVKDESTRLGLPAFKILGASWATYRAIAAKQNLPLGVSLAEISRVAQSQGLKLFAATDGNHGRAVARMASMLGLDAKIVMPDFVDVQTRERVACEGADVNVITGDYDAAVVEAAREANATTGGLLIQDNSFKDYEQIPGWVVDGYSTMLVEIEDQLSEQNLKADIVVTAVGAGCLAHAVVSFCKSNGRGISVLAVEAETAACLNDSLKVGTSTTVSTSRTICEGMNCGTVSPTSWPILRSGIDASVTVSDLDTHTAVQKLVSQGVNAGPCGAATLAGLIDVSSHRPEAINLEADSVVVLLCTEGIRQYTMPGS